MELEKHIEILLLDNDCVIVPGLGGFIAYHTDASYDAESASFLPPSRIAGFNPKLSMNDNLLAQSYVETYDISYPEAVKRITAEAEELRNSLERNGYHDLPGIGTLRVNAAGGFDFEPFEAGLLTPELYGLGCFEAALTEAEVTAGTVNEDIAEKHGKFIKIRVSTVRNIAAAAIAVFAFFLLSSPLGNSDMNVASVASLQNSVFNRIMPQGVTPNAVHPAANDFYEKTIYEKHNANRTVKGTNSDTIASHLANNISIDGNASRTVKEVNLTSNASNTFDKATPSVKKSTVMNSEASKAKGINKSQDYYCIVLASALSKNNAGNFVEKLTKEGKKDIYAIDCSNGMKVVCGRFDSEKAARSSLDTLRDGKDFKDAWIYKVKVKK